MLALARRLRRAIHAHDDVAIGAAYLDLSDRIGPVKGSPYYFGKIVR